jgi:hypothetical protein
MAMIRTEMHWHSRADEGVILPQGPNDVSFPVRLGEPATLAKRYLQGTVKNAGDADVALKVQTSEDGETWADLASFGTVTVKAKAEKQISIAIPAAAEYWRVAGTGETNGIVEWIEAEGSHANIGLP